MFRASTYRVLIASPSDLSEERLTATDAINEWNAQHSAAESVVLLPVKWETHATPRVGVRPQEAVNVELVDQCDILVGMFWTRIGTDTGVARSGTVEEIDRCTAAGKDVLLYFSNRPIDPNKINMTQHRKLKKFKDATYQKALTGTFASLNELRQTLANDLTRIVRKLRSKGLPETDTLDQAVMITNLIRMHKRHNITPEEFMRYRSRVIGLRRQTNAKVPDPIEHDQLGPNGFPVGYTKEGDKVEWIPDDENPGKQMPMLLRRNDVAILKAHEEYWDKVWWTRHQYWVQRIESGQERLTDGQKSVYVQARGNAGRLERKYGKHKLKDMLWDDFERGLITGRLSALAWITGAEWEHSMDT